LHTFDEFHDTRRADSSRRAVRVLSVIAALAVIVLSTEASPKNTIAVSINRAEAQSGDTVGITLRLDHDGIPSATEVPHAVMLTPGTGTGEVTLTRDSQASGTYHADVVLGNQAPEGLYIVHAWTGDPENPSAVGKGSFRSGAIVGDFFIVPMIDTLKPDEDMNQYLQSFRKVGGNLLIAHNLITSAKAFYASKICRTDVRPGTPQDLVELTLSHADRAGMAVMLSVSWDVTGNSPYKDRMKEIQSIIDEMYSLYAHHPSLIGFYAYQEASGTYYLPFIREFCDHVKAVNRNLLTGCAPYLDDPLLAGYLSVVPSLDIIIYQAGVMASYRTDNMKKYPFRRIRDIDGLGAGARRVQSKIALNHVELFGYPEQSLHPGSFATTCENIIRQILSAATITDADGIAFFTYHAHVYSPLKTDSLVEESRRGVVDGMKAFRLITSQITQKQNPIAVYFPYSDWIVERWADNYLPAFDAFRLLGIPVDIIPYAPPVEESLLPYYPFHLNPDVLTRLTKERTVLVLPDVSGFQQTDSDLIKAYLEAGGVIVAFGPQIPRGRSYERDELFGLREGGKKEHRSVLVQSGGQHAWKGERFPLHGVTTSQWAPVSASLVAAFEDGSPAIVTNRYGEGVTVSIATSASTAARYFPALVLDVIDHALKFAGHRRVADVLGLSEKSDIASVLTSAGFRIALANHDTTEQDVQVVPLDGKAGGPHEWIDLFTGEPLPSPRSKTSLRVSIPPSGFRCIEYRLR
jgi:hypothetical protein